MPRRWPVHKAFAKNGVLRGWNTQDNVFLLLRSKDTFKEFRIEGNKSREYSTAERSRHWGFKSDELFF